MNTFQKKLIYDMEAAEGPKDTEPLMGEKKVSKTSHRFGMMLHGLWFILFLALSLYAHDISVQLNQDVKKLRTDLVKLGNEAAAQRAIIQTDVDVNEFDSDDADTAIRVNVDKNKAASVTADAAIQADVDKNKDASVTADGDLQDAIDVVQTDVDNNEAASDAADDTMTTNIPTAAATAAAIAAGNVVDGKLADIDGKITAVQTDVDNNEADSDAADAAIRVNITTNKAASDAADAAIRVNITTNTGDIATNTANISQLYNR